MMTQQSAEGFAAWLARNNPALFDKLAERIGTHQMSGFWDAVKSVGAGIGTAVKNVGSFLTTAEGQALLGTAAGAYLENKAQKNALQVQLELARAGLPPAPIGNVVNPATQQQVPHYVDPQTGRAYPVTDQIAARLMPAKSWQEYLPWFILAGGGAVLLFALTRR